MSRMSVISLYLVFVFFLGLQSARAQANFLRRTTGPLVTDSGLSRGVNLVDYDGDGWADIYVCNSANRFEENRLYQNNGDGTFTRIDNHTLTTFAQNSDCASWADYDNDGDLDVYISTWSDQVNRLYRNTGEGQFEQVIGSPTTAVTTYSDFASWHDWDRDGHLDLFVGRGFTVLNNQLFQNNGDSTLSEFPGTAISLPSLRTHAGGWADFNNDGWGDLFVANASNQSNELYFNNGDSSFTAVTEDTVVKDFTFSLRSAIGDYDNDGDFDLVVSNGLGQPNLLYENNGLGTFTQISTAPVATDLDASQSAAFADFDNDADLDLLILNGFGSALQTNFLYWNNGDGTFVRDTLDPLATDTGWALGLSLADIDHDGDLDVLVGKALLNKEPNALYINQGTANHWLEIDPTGVASNRDAIGSRITTVATVDGSPVRQVRQITDINSFGSSGLTAWFGLGDATTADSIIIDWSSGRITTLTGVAADQTLEVVECTDADGDRDCDNCPETPNPGQDPAACSCCQGQTGNVDADAEGTVNLTDLTLLVNHLFVTFDPIPCPEAANTSGDPGGDLTLTGLTALVNHLFVTFEPLAPCQPAAG